ncbi:hypothetical protein CRG98_045890 [Punica granatum]|uniref:Disease resistance protein Roq1-like winged-helix domain-containing protein n=1 Tax=Punica granatum TaxID=22663 RepID=A0A2I0HPU5_PUNGR|nr:hypothetical protein CRG98_045890 [Punica granatum]
MGRLPLALEVIGSFLSAYRGRMDMWEGTMEQLKRKPHMLVQDKLMISYESLDDQQKEIFLDIACFFSGEDVRDLIPMWDDCDFFPTVAIEILQLKSLIRIRDGNTLWMHDQLVDLGRLIVEQENYKEPELRSRLWRSEEAIDVLMGEQGSSKVEAAAISAYEGRVTFTNECFKNLSKLRVLRLYGVELDGTFLHFLPKLRWLRLPMKTATLPANLHLSYLTSLDLSRSKIDGDLISWSSIKLSSIVELNLDRCGVTRLPRTLGNLDKLEVLAGACASMTKVPADLRGLLNLRKKRSHLRMVKSTPADISRFSHPQKGVGTLFGPYSVKSLGSSTLTFLDLSGLVDLKELYLCGDLLKGECLAKLCKLEILQCCKTARIVQVEEFVVHRCFE